MNKQLEIAVAALEQIAVPHGVLCHTCGQKLADCASDQDPDVCAAKLAREAITAIGAAPVETLADEWQARVEAARAEGKIEGLRLALVAFRGDGYLLDAIKAIEALIAKETK